MYLIIKKVWTKLTAAERRKLLLYLFSDLAISILDIAFLVLILWVINFSAAKAPSSYVVYYKFYRSHFALVCIFIAAGFTLKNLLGYSFNSASIHFNYKVASRLSATSLDDYLRSGYLSHVNTDSSVHIHKISQQPIEFAQYVLTGLQQIFTQCFLILFAVSGIIIYNPRLFCLMLLFLSLPIIIISWILKKRVASLRTGIRRSNEKTLQHLKEALSAYIETHIYKAKAFFSNRYTSYQNKLNGNLSSLQAVQLFPSRIFEIFAIAGVFVILAFNSRGNNIITIGVFVTAAYKIIPGLVKIITSTAQIKAYEHTIDHLPEPDSKNVDQQFTAKKIDNINFSNISFAYTDKVQLKNLSFELQAGDFAALTGASGKGKTTIINLLQGFLERQSGSISFNGQVVNAKDIAAYHSCMAYVRQQTLIIHDSILKNITLSDAQPDQERLDLALAISGLAPVVAKYPDGLNHLITENGANISGGQRQRLMLARALYKNFDLLILDEPFSELDTESEAYILHQLQQLANNGKIILMITHHLQTLHYCNKVINLEN
ncbi:ATP-binding cassette domain-containing protein [Mucilaginibacter sp. KACC 22063]|uniref:ATP-binding cassette domain-containing protein n=1 Tax=Mucilaginibacter sp. KACC 22063 TaxID=3025666 RepID=UPI002366D77E|nr:ABC transporter ATP-binding protein [Mucilaginibacter sp. KACC 22063]WDF53803.1 ABC transporter ATP-binding protein [Mucilaginibacter sp. KACC 22063]